jgi:hypothetical protein
MEQPCPTCGSQNPSDLNFCMYCGNKLEITSISTKVPQFRFPPMRSLVAGSTGNTGSNSPVDTGSTDKIAYKSLAGTRNIDKTEYNAPVDTENIDKTEYNSSADRNIGNIEYDLPSGWVTSDSEYNVPVGGATGSIVYETSVSSSDAGNVSYDLPASSSSVDNIGYDLTVSSGDAGNIGYNISNGSSNADYTGYELPASSGGADNIGYNMPVSSEDAGHIGYNMPVSPHSVGNSAYSSPVNSGYISERNGSQQGRLVQQRAGAPVLAPAQLGSMLGSIPGRLPRHAFAGRGSRMTRHSWLLDGEYLNAANLHTAVVNLLSQRNSQTLKLKVEKLQEHGHRDEERDYIVMQQGITTVFLYIAPVGQDLYISRTTTVQPPFNPFRIFLLIFALGEFLVGPSVLSHLLSSLAMHKSAGGGITLIIPFTIVILLIPSVLFLVTFLLASLRHWFTEKDFWVYLRRNTLNDFEVDDVMLLEHVADDAVRAAVAQLNLDATKITPPVLGYQPRRRIRTI